MAGLLGPGADAESLVLGLINRQDRYLAPRTCHARRRELGARTTTLVLPKDKAGEAVLPVLPSVDLASSFPSVRTLVLRCMEGPAREGWPERFAAFVSRNAAALQQLRHLDMGCDQRHLHHAPHQHRPGRPGAAAQPAEPARQRGQGAEHPLLGGAGQPQGS
jgi:hypothetical protein